MRIMDRVQAPVPAFAVFLITAIVVYGVFGSPTPDHPGVWEAAVGILLILAIGAAGIKNAFTPVSTGSPYLKILQIFFLTGLLLPCLSAVYAGNDPVLVLRDVAAFLFLGLPLFLSMRFDGRPDLVRKLSFALVFAGLCFCIRTLVPVFNIWIPAGELLYLSNSPLAILAGLLLTGLGWNAALKQTPRSFMFAFLCGTGALVIVAAMILDVQRATIGAMALSGLVLFLFSLVETPRRVVFPVTVLLAGGWIFRHTVLGILQAMEHKTALVGFNARIAEAHAVIENVSYDPVAFFIGRGWGATFSSPAVAGLEVNYTHSLLTTMLLKGGLILFCVCGLMLVAALYQIFLIFQRDRVSGLALFWSVIIPSLLYASHKSLDFGLVLLMTGVWSVAGGALQNSASSDKK